MKRFSILLMFGLLVQVLIACSSGETLPTNKEPTNSTVVEEDGPTKESTEVLDYGKVSFLNVIVHANGFDGVKIRPTFTIPEVCSEEVFEYEIANETVCYIEDNQVFFLSEGTTKVTATSQHLKGTFYVFAQKFDFTAQANNQMQRLLNSYQGEETLFLGDSFFEFWRNGTNGVLNFSEVFAEYDVFNIGISATTTHDWRAINVKIGERVAAPKNIVINIGINNVDDDNESGKQCANNIQALIEDYLEMYPETNIYYLSITRCSGVFAYKWSNHEISNTLMKEYCEKTERVHYLDIMALYGEEYANYQVDGLHPNQAGYNLFETIIKQEVPLNKKNN